MATLPTATAISCRIAVATFDGPWAPTHVPTPGMLTAASAPTTPWLADVSFSAA